MANIRAPESTKGEGFDLEKKKYAVDRNAAQSLASDQLGGI